MDQTPQPEDAAEIASEERRADVQRRMEEVAGVLAETLLGMWRAKHRAERRGEPWPPPEPPKPEPPRTSGLIEKPKGPPRRVFRNRCTDPILVEMIRPPQDGGHGEGDRRDLGAACRSVESERAVVGGVQPRA
jgi:hypothetical protein